MPPPEHVEALRRPASVCASCGSPLSDLPKHDSRLASAGGGVIERQDFCPACQAQARAGEYHSRWLAMRPAPSPPPKRETRKALSQRLRDEFLRLTELPAPSDDDRDTLYLLAHLLMKTGGFKWRETDEGRGVLLFEDQATKEICEVQTVTLDRDRLAQAQERLRDLL